MDEEEMFGDEQKIEDDLEREEMLEPQRKRSLLEGDAGRPKLRRSTIIAEKRHRDERPEQEQEAEEQAVRGTISLIEKE
eukprot:9429204-Heterocapsa_arctica.AAC.1